MSVFVDGSQDEEEEEAKPVTMKFARQETEEAKARRMASYDYLQRKREEEAWLPLRFHTIEVGVQRPGGWPRTTTYSARGRRRHGCLSDSTL